MPATAPTTRSHTNRWTQVLALLVAAVVAVVALSGTASAAPPPTQCPAAAGNARIVRWTYFVNLIRCPDAGGLAYWTGKLDHGQSRAAFARGLLSSPENTQLVVEDAFPILYGRAGSPAEISTAAKAFAQSGSYDAVLESLALAPEFAIRRPTPDAQVSSLYLAYWLTNDGDVAGHAYWKQFLANGGKRSTFVHALAASDVHLTWMVGQAYGNAFFRAPDAGGLAYWKGVYAKDHDLLRLESIFQASDEFAATAQTQPHLPT